MKRKPKQTRRAQVGARKNLHRKLLSHFDPMPINIPTTKEKTNCLFKCVQMKRTPVKARRPQVGAKDRIAFRCTTEEKQAIQSRAKAARMSLSVYALSKL